MTPQWTPHEILQAGPQQARKTFVVPETMSICNLIHLQGLFQKT